jgi:hypothetical protein
MVPRRSLGVSVAATAGCASPGARTPARGGEQLCMDEPWDEHHRLRSVSVPGMSWWFTEHGITRQDRKAMSGEQCLALVGRYWRAVAGGWWPDVPRSAWVGPHHPFEC